MVANEIKGSERRAGPTGQDSLGVPALAKELGVTMRTLYKILDSGKLASSYKIGRVIRIKRADIDAFLDGARVKPGELRHLYPPGENDPPRKR